MKLSEIVAKLGLEALNPETARAREDADVTGGHASDLLSDALANSPAGGILVTILVHMNVVAVAVHAELAAVVFAAGMHPGADVVERASKEGLPLYGVGEPAFDVVGRLYGFGLRGGRREGA